MIHNKAEAAFASTLRERGVEYEYQPRGFRLYYRPDFYVPSTKCYYEVVGTRQALSLNAPKITAFRRTYPELVLQIVDAKGESVSLPESEFLRKALKATLPGKQCPHCSHVWVPKGKNKGGPRRCPKCWKLVA